MPAHSQQNHHDRPAPPYEPYEPWASGNTENTPLVPRQVMLRRTGLRWFFAVLIGFTLVNLFSASYVSQMGSRLSMERGIWERDFKLRLERLHQQEEHQRQREEQWDQARQRQKLSLHWANQTAEARCHTYNTRYYHAILLTTPPNQAFDVDLCQEISLDIHDRSIYPTRCEADEKGVVHGGWKVQFNEPACKPYWDNFHDKGCSAPYSGKRRYEARLENIGFGEDGMKLCYETPTDVHRSHFNKPESCIYKDEYEIYGTWAASDRNCL